MVTFTKDSLLIKIYPSRDEMGKNAAKEIREKM